MTESHWNKDRTANPIYLDYTVSCLFDRERYLSNFVHRLYASNITRIRDLISYSEDELFSKVKTRTKNQEKVKNILRDIGLEFRR